MGKLVRGQDDEEEDELSLETAGVVQLVMEEYDKRWTPNNLVKTGPVMFKEPKRVYDGDTLEGIVRDVRNKAVDNFRRRYDGMGRHETRCHVDKGAAQEKEA